MDNSAEKANKRRGIPIHLENLITRIGRSFATWVDLPIPSRTRPRESRQRTWRSWGTCTYNAIKELSTCRIPSGIPLSLGKTESFYTVFAVSIRIHPICQTRASISLPTVPSKPCVDQVIASRGTEPPYAYGECFLFLHRFLLLYFGSNVF